MVKKRLGRILGAQAENRSSGRKSSPSSLGQIKTPPEDVGMAYILGRYRASKRATDSCWFPRLVDAAGASLQAMSRVLLAVSDSSAAIGRCAAACRQGGCFAT